MAPRDRVGVGFVVDDREIAAVTRHRYAI